MKIKIKIKIISLIASVLISTNSSAITIHDSGPLLSSSDPRDPYTQRADYDYPLGSLFVFEDFYVNENLTINSIEYHVLSGTSTHSYNNTHLHIFQDSPYTGNLVSDSIGLADISHYGNDYFLAMPDGSIANPYLHTINDLEIALNPGHYYLGISVDDTSFSYLGVNTQGEVTLTIEGVATTAVPLPAALWLFVMGIGTLLASSKLGRKAF